MKLCLLVFILVPVFLPAEPLYSPTWGFRMDLPEGYEYVDGNNLDRYSFHGPGEAQFDIAVYDGVYQNVEQMARDVNRLLGNTGDTAFFDYEGMDAALFELRFGSIEGWGFGVELEGGTAGNPPLLLALAYAPAGKPGMDLLHLSALDSLAPSQAQMRRPGPITEFGYPRGKQKEAPISGTKMTTLVRENDAVAAQALIEREFALLTRYQFSPDWQEAWTRYYRMIYRDSWDRVADAVFQLERGMRVGAENMDERSFAEKALAFVQNFDYERDFAGSDFVNLVTAVTEGKGDCDSRAMLWVMILSQSNIPAAMMVSRNHSHAMGLANLAGTGARFEAGGIRWLVAETTDTVGIGLISADMSDMESWLGVLFE